MPVSISGLNEAFSGLEQRVAFGARAGLREAGEVIKEGIERNFDEKGARGGNPEWEPVPVYWLSQRQTWPMDPSAQRTYVEKHLPLVDTGRLRDSMVYVDVENSDGSIEAAVQPTVDYAEDHELGVPGKIRQRPFMFVTEEEIVLAQAAVYESLKESFHG